MPFVGVIRVDQDHFVLLRVARAQVAQPAVQALRRTQHLPACDDRPEAVADLEVGHVDGDAAQGSDAQEVLFVSTRGGEHGRDGGQASNLTRLAAAAAPYCLSSPQVCATRGCSRCAPRPDIGLRRVPLAQAATAG